MVEAPKNDSKIEQEPSIKKLKIPKEKLAKKWIVLLVAGIVCFLGGLGCFLGVFLTPKEVISYEYPKIPSSEDVEEAYSLLTGEALKDANQKSAPTFCIQVPNGTDGARPQAGLTEAGVIYEAIAEAGITRFDAVFQNPTTAIIGPIRSLRTYYLDFAAPFGCTIVHAGGPSDAIGALRSGGYRDLDESYTYMYRGSYGYRLWNNLFTTANLLKQFNQANGYSSSDIKGFARLTPAESNKSRIDALVASKLIITEAAEGNTSKLVAKTDEINLNFASSNNFNVQYFYDVGTNTYRRGYATGTTHEVYQCASEDLGEKNPEDHCKLTALSPSVVIAMMVAEKRASDNYHEDVTMIGSGDAYIFQNGTAVKASWSKTSRNDQIKFLNSDGEEIKLAPGQTMISAVPNYGSVDY